jgi:hypothetical protein
MGLAKVYGELHIFVLKNRRSPRKLQEDGRGKKNIRRCRGSLRLLQVHQTQTLVLPLGLA